MRLIQFKDSQGARKVGMVALGGESVRAIIGVASVYELALDAIKKNTTLEAVTNPRLSFQSIDFNELLAQQRVLPPLDHPDPARCLVTGTGLSHLGSAAARDAMHVKMQKAESELTDSMKMFKWGVEGGKPAAGKIGVQPEWFYKGDGRCVVAPEHALDLPPYANDGGDEVEVVGLYSIGPSQRATGSASRSATSTPITSWSARTICISRIRNCANALTAPSCWLAHCPTRATDTRVCCAKATRCGKAIGSPATTIWRTRSPTSNTITSSTPTSPSRRRARAFLRRRDRQLHARRED